MAKVIQSTPSLGSLAGIVTMVVGVALAMFLLNQTNIGKTLVSGQVPSLGQGS